MFKQNIITMRNLFITLSFLLLYLGCAYSQKDTKEPTINVIVNKNIEIRTQFRITFEVNSNNPKNLKAPDFKGFKVIYGPTQSSSTSTTILNGETNTEYKVSYTYILETTEEGDFTIQSASVTVDGKTITSKPVTIKVASAEKLNKIKEKEEKDKKASIPIKLEAFAPDSIQIGERFRVIFEVNTQEDNMKLKDPVFDDFLVLAGPSISTSNAIDYVNGERVLISKTSYVYILEAEKMGIFTIPSTEIAVSGKKYKSQPVKIKIVEKIEYKSPQQRKREEKSGSVFL